MKKQSLIAVLLAFALVFTLLPTGLAQEAADTVSEATDTSTEEPAEAGFALGYAQKELDSRVVTVTVEDLAALAAEADTIKLSFTMSYKGQVTRSYETEKAVSELSESDPSFEVTLPFFGKWQAAASSRKDGQSVSASTAVEVALGVTECNIVSMNATTDVLIESIKLSAGKAAIEAKGMAAMDESIPTIVGMARNKQYDWDKLPENLYPTPLTTDDQTRNGMSYSEHMDALSQYVADLYEINSETIFHFYINDVHLYVFPKLCYYNAIPADHYTLTLVTDGSGSYTTFRDAYTNQTVYNNTGAQDAADLHQKYIDMYLAFRQNVIDGNVEPYLQDFSGEKQCYWVASPHYEQTRISHYIYAILDAEEQAGCLKTEWWVVRKSTDTFGLNERDAEFQAKVLADPRITNNYINNCLVALENADNTEGFKDLYHFDTEAFQEARDQGKKPLMIIGTSASTERNLPPLHYIRMMQEFYGDEYAFFYKGHPGNYAMDNEANQKPYLDVGVQVLESSIAAELFEFFNPDLYCAGYSSSFFQNIGTEHNLALWNWTKEVAAENPDVKSYAEAMDIFISEVTGSGSSSTFNGSGAVYEEPQRLRDAILELTAQEVAQGDRIYLAQFQNTAEHTVAPYDNAVWNATEETLSYLSEQEDGTFELIAFSDAPVTPPSEEPSTQPSSSTGTGSRPSSGNRNPSGVGAAPAAPKDTKDDEVTTAKKETNSAGDTVITLTSAQGETLVKVELPATIPAPETRFADVPEGHWADAAIHNMASLGLVEGVGANTYDMASPVTRGAIVTMLFRLSNGKGGQNASFADVAADAWYADAVGWASALELVNGYNDQTFGPQDAITRQQLAVMIARFAKLVGVDTQAQTDLSAFSDGASADTWAVDSLAWCVEHDVMKGRGDNVLAPTATVTRAEAATMLDRAINPLR